MKKLKYFIPAFFSLFLLTSCLDLDLPNPCVDGHGWLNFENRTAETLRINIDGTNYGTIDPGDDEDYKLPVGKYLVKVTGTDGDGGCSPAYVTIAECSTESRFCGN
jgi:hypothetical protein